MAPHRDHEGAYDHKTSLDRRTESANHGARVKRERSMTRLQRISIAASSVIGLFVAYEIASSFIAYTADAYVESDLVAVAPQVTGRIIGVNVIDNQNVAEGDLLATIDPV